MAPFPSLDLTAQGKSWLAEPGVGGGGARERERETESKSKPFGEVTDRSCNLW